MKTIFALAASGCLLAAPVLAQEVFVRDPGRTGTVIQQQPNTTGNDPSLSISRGPNGADTITTNSAAGGNASRPEQAIPNGSANGGGGGR